MSAGCPTDPGAGGGAAVGGAGRFRDGKKVAGRAGALHCGSARWRGAPGRCGQVLDVFILQKISLKLVVFLNTRPFRSFLRSIDWACDIRKACRQPREKLQERQAGLQAFVAVRV